MDLRIERVLRVFRGNFERSSGDRINSEYTTDLRTFLLESNQPINQANGTMTPATAIRLFKIITNIVLYIMRLPAIPAADWNEEDIEASRMMTAIASLGTTSTHPVLTTRSRFTGYRLIPKPDLIFLASISTGRLFSGRKYSETRETYLTASDNTFVLAGHKIRGSVRIFFPDDAVQPAANVAAGQNAPDPAPLVPPLSQSMESSHHRELLFPLRTYSMSTSPLLMHKLEANDNVNLSTLEYVNNVKHNVSKGEHRAP